MATSEEFSDRHLEMSQYLINKAQEELSLKNDLIQASEKAWGSVAQALKAVAAARGWNHRTHGLLSDIATQLYLEFGRPRLVTLYGSAELLHNNFYEHRLERDRIPPHIDLCRELLEELRLVRTSPPRRFTPATQEQIHRLERLTRRTPNVLAEDSQLDIASLPPVEPQS
jgi:hypothetical protein